MTAAHDHEEHFAGSGPEAAGTGQRPLSIVVGIWESGRGDLSERHDEITRDRLKRSAWRGG